MWNFQRLRLTIISHQCDQMVKLCFQYLDVYKKGNFPNITKMYLRRFKILPNTNQILKEWPKMFFPKWKNLTKSGHTVSHMCYHGRWFWLQKDRLHVFKGTELQFSADHNFCCQIWLKYSVTRRLDYFFDIWPFTTKKFVQ